MTTKDTWEFMLDRTPEDNELRLVYADWLEEHDDPLCQVQRWLALHDKRPGPCCVLEAVWHEATWFSPAADKLEWIKPTFDDRYAERIIIQPAWCLPWWQFNSLQGYIPADKRRDHGRHQYQAKSWLSRREAEWSLLGMDLDNPPALLVREVMGPTIGHTAGLDRVNFD